MLPCDMVRANIHLFITQMRKLGFDPLMLNDILGQHKSISIVCFCMTLEKLLLNASVLTSVKWEQADKYCL